MHQRRTKISVTAAKEKTATVFDRRKYKHTGRWIRTRSAASLMCQWLFPLLFAPVFSLNDPPPLFPPSTLPNSSRGPFVCWEAEILSSQQQQLMIHHSLSPSASSSTAALFFSILSHSLCTCAWVCMCVCVCWSKSISFSLSWPLQIGFWVLFSNHFRSVCCTSWKAFALVYQYSWFWQNIQFPSDANNKQWRKEFFSVFFLCVLGNLLYIAFASL